MPLSLGSRLGPYEIETALGRGGMGEVYRARDARLRRSVALKVLTGAVGHDPGFRDRFDREARAISALNHPNICTLFDIGQQDGIAFLVMELLDGATLAARITRGPLSHAEVLSIGSQIGAALDAAHRAGIVHRDLKPGNVMLTKASTGSAGSSQAKLLDFGLARPVQQTEGIETTQAALTARGDLVGTLPYMAPEQLEGREVDARTDIWAFGCVLYEMVSGHRAFEASSDARLISAILTMEPPPLTSSPLDRLIRKCLAKDPDRRWQTAADLTDELRWIGGQAGESVASASASVVTGHKRVPRWRSVMFAAAALAVAAAGIAAGYFLRPAPEVPRTRFDLQPPFKSQWGDGLAISPDGKRVAFVAVSGGRSSIWTHELEDDTRTRELAGTDGADLQLFWSPDSVSLGFFAGGKLKTIAADGGPVQVRAEAPLPGGGTWNRDGVIVFSAEARKNGLSRVRADGGPVAELTALGAGEGPHRAPMFLPDGRHLLYVSRDKVFATSLDDPGRRVPVLDTPSSVQFAGGHLLFVRDGSLWAQPFDLSKMAVFGDATRIVDRVDRLTDRSFTRDLFSVSEAGVLLYRTVGVQPVRQFVWVDRRGLELERVPVTGAIDSPALSPDGTRLAFSMDSSGNRDIWVLVLNQPVPRRLTFDSEDDVYPLWSPDGSRIAFSRGGNGNKGIFEINVVSQDSERNLSPPHKLAQYPHSYTKDSRRLLVSKWHGGLNGGLFTLSLDSERRLVEFLDTPANELQPRLSPPDDLWVAYMSLGEGGYEVYVERYPSRGRKTQVSNGATATFHWRADGGELLYVGRDNHLMAVPMKDGARTSLPESLFDLGAVRSFAVARDGQRFLISRPATGSDTKAVKVVMNWPALLKR